MAHDSFGGLNGWDLEGFHSGGDTELWKRLGAHVVTIHDEERGEVTGTRFAVWAPNAREVRINADFNWWTGDAMHLVPGSGVWALFVEGVGDGTLYKYNILGADGVWREKVDPMAFFAEQAPANSSIVYTSKMGWGDDEWMEARKTKNYQNEPMSIYEVHLGSWRKGKTYLELADELVEYVTWQGYTHVEFMPITEHPFEPSWGYQVTNYFAPQSRLGKPDELRYLIDRLHQAGIGVILDWVPGHFPKDEWALGRFDGTALYEHADPRQGEHKDWGTYIFNYGRNEVKSFLVSNALYWVQEFHIDALRVDAVASMLYLDYSREPGQWVPNEFGGNHNLEAIDFLRYVNRHLYERVPGVTMIAEESTSFGGVTQPTNLGGLGLRLQVEHGLDERLAALPGARADLPPVAPPRDDVRDGLPVQRELHPADQPRRGRARQGLDDQQDPAGRVAPVRHPARVLLVHVGLPGQAAAVHGPGVRPAVGVQRGRQPRVVGLRPVGPPRPAAHDQGPQRALQGPPGPVEARQRPVRVPVDQRRRRRPQRLRVGAP